nr:MAG: hypothetical protein [Bacteriophage sp.]
MPPLDTEPQVERLAPSGTSSATLANNYILLP